MVMVLRWPKRYALQLSRGSSAFGVPVASADTGSEPVGFVNPPNEDWDGERRYYADKRLDLLSFLMYSWAMGGTPVTNAIGRWLQSIGANALVYPSARSDARCNVQGDQLVDFAGFVLVDYRDGVAIPNEVRIICEPYSWKENWGHVQSDSGGEWSGAWAIRGITRALVQTKRQQLDEYYRSHGVSERKASSSALSKDGPAGLRSLASRIRRRTRGG